MHHRSLQVLIKMNEIAKLPHLLNADGKINNLRLQAGCMETSVLRYDDFFWLGTRRETTTRSNTRVIVGSSETNTPDAFHHAFSRHDGSRVSLRFQQQPGGLAGAWPGDSSSYSTCVRARYPWRIGEEAKTIKHRWSFSRL